MAGGGVDVRMFRLLPAQVAVVADKPRLVLAELAAQAGRAARDCPPRRMWWATTTAAVTNAAEAYQAPSSAALKRTPAGLTCRKDAMMMLAFVRP